MKRKIAFFSFRGNLCFSVIGTFFFYSFGMALSMWLLVRKSVREAD